jgi:hypothetical protein
MGRVVPFFQERQGCPGGMLVSAQAGDEHGDVLLF